MASLRWLIMYIFSLMALQEKNNFFFNITFTTGRPLPCGFTVYSVWDKITKIYTTSTIIIYTNNIIIVQTYNAGPVNMSGNLYIFVIMNQFNHISNKKIQQICVVHSASTYKLTYILSMKKHLQEGKIMVGQQVKGI